MRYPDAIWKGNGHDGGSYMGVPWRVVLHTTETVGMPGYLDGWHAPHLTLIGDTFYQHTDLAMAARSLRNEKGGIETNRDNALQVEIVAFTSLSEADKHAGSVKITELPERSYAALRRFIDWTSTQYGVQPVWPVAGRMDAVTWNRYHGVCGHVHIRENTHTDPTGIDYHRLGLVRSPAAGGLERGHGMFVEVHLHDGYGVEFGDPDVEEWQELLNALGAGLTVDGKYGPATAEAIAAIAGDGTRIGPVEGARILARFAPRQRRQIPLGVTVV